MGERLLCKQEVIGSIPFTSTTGEPRLAARQALLEPFGEAELRRFGIAPAKPAPEATPKAARATLGAEVRNAAAGRPARRC